ncbi:helix-turn-helix transcriptional regulator [Aliikangiella maris]|uniref:AraC family transcriptional regulator n=2 Tax=Aliikangiella maris TaxID=3162458 RepID=A0ABV2BRB5_9GAMM
MQPPTQQDINRIYRGFNQASAVDYRHQYFISARQFGDNNQGVHLDFKQSIATGYWELYRPHRDLLICLADSFYHQDFIQKIKPVEDIVSIRFVLSGNYQVTYADHIPLGIPRLTVSILSTHKNDTFDLSIQQGNHLSSVTLHLRPDYFMHHVNLGGSSCSLTSPLFLDKIFNQKQLFNIPLLPAMRSDVLTLLKMPYLGTRRRLYTESKSLVLLCQLFHYIEEFYQQSALPLDINERLIDKLAHAKQLITQNYQSPLTIIELARRVGLNRSTLCGEFKRQYHCTVHEFLQNYRMNKARELLQSSSMSISQIAERVGYEYATNFTTAFKKQFSVLPKAYRTKKTL